MLWARILADVVVVVHALFVVAVVFGQAGILLGLALGWGWVRNCWLRVLHLAAIGVVAAQAVCGVVCPLTTLENSLRRLAGQQAYPGAFVGYWAHRLLFFEAPPWVFTAAYCTFGLVVVATFVLGPPRRPRLFQDGGAARADVPQHAVALDGSGELLTGRSGNPGMSVHDLDQGFGRRRFAQAELQDRRSQDRVFP